MPPVPAKHIFIIYEWSQYEWSPKGAVRAISAEAACSFFKEKYEDYAGSTLKAEELFVEEA